MKPKKIVVRIIAVLILGIILNSCKSTKNLFLFDTKELNLKYKKVQKLGFKPLKGQVNILTKAEKDTTIYISFDRFERSRSKSWMIEFPLKKYDLVNDSIYKFLINKNIPPITRVHYYKDSTDFSFTAHSLINEHFYLCQVSNDSIHNKTYLELTTYLPYSNSKIKKNIKYQNIPYKDRYMIPMDIDIEEEEIKK